MSKLYYILKYKYYLIFILIILVGLIPRFTNLNSDPPACLSPGLINPSNAIYTDGGNNNQDARTSVF